MDKKPTSLEILSKPFDWIEIPSAKGTMKTSKEGLILDIPTETYSMAKYPVTYRQYGHFMELGGYTNDKWWTKRGIEAREKYNLTRPLWRGIKTGDADKPVVGISWYEAIAFCLWLSDESGEWITLPTEAQWQYAAQGSDDRHYPWGNILCGNECKNAFILDGLEGNTRPVTHYEGLGDSRFGVVDMVGNVYEWCLTNPRNRTNDFDSEADRRVMRGGCWDDFSPSAFLCYTHNWGTIYMGDARIGFRIARL